VETFAAVSADVSIGDFSFFLTGGTKLRSPCFEFELESIIASTNNNRCCIKYDEISAAAAK